MSRTPRSTTQDRKIRRLGRADDNAKLRINKKRASGDYAQDRIAPLERGQWVDSRFAKAKSPPLKVPRDSTLRSSSGLGQ